MARLHSYPEPGLEAPWKRFLEQQRYPTNYLSPEFFLDPILGSRKPFAVVATLGDQVIGILTGTHDKKHVRCGNSGSPQLCVSSNHAAEALGQLLSGLYSEIGEAKGCSLSTFSDLPQLKAHGYFERLPGVTMMLDLSEGPDKLYRQFSKGRRSDIQYAIRSGVEIVEATSESDFEEYYKLHVIWCERKQIQPHSREIMLRALTLRSNRRVFLAVHEQKVIAGTIIRFLEHGIAEYAANNSLEEYQNLRANPLLNWTAIQWAFDFGLRNFSMGGSHPYLRHFGGSEVAIHRYSTDASFLKLFRLREWLVAKRKPLTRE